MQGGGTWIPAIFLQTYNFALHSRNWSKKLWNTNQETHIVFVTINYIWVGCI